jgi:hypothetical protein
MTDHLASESDLTAKPPMTFAVLLVAAGANEAFPGVPLTNTRLPSLDTPEIQDWVSQHTDSVIFVLPDEQGKVAESAQTRGKPSLPAQVEADEYDSLLALISG